MKPVRTYILFMVGLIPFVLQSCMGHIRSNGPVAVNDTTVVFADWNSVRNIKNPDVAVGYDPSKKNDTAVMMVCSKSFGNEDGDEHIFTEKLVFRERNK